MNAPIWGIDLGGTKMEGIIMKSIEDPSPIARIRIDTEASKGYAHILDRIEELVKRLQEQSGQSPKRIGFATPGILDPHLQVMKNCNTTALNGKRFKTDLENKLQLQIEIANDANCFALAETKWGVVQQKAPEAKVVFGIILGTGVGGGIVIDGKVWNGCHGIGGEWGHNFLDDSGGGCYCGKSGCVETILSGPALEKYYGSVSGGNRLSLKEISVAHTESASETMNRLTHFFGKAISVVINILDPDVIVVGGGVGNIDAIYSAGVDSLKKYIFNSRADVPILKPILGDSAGVFGAAALVA